MGPIYRDSHEPIPEAVLPLFVPPAPPIHFPGYPPKEPLPEMLLAVGLDPTGLSVAQPAAKSVTPTRAHRAIRQNGRVIASPEAIGPSFVGNSFIPHP